MLRFDIGLRRNGGEGAAARDALRTAREPWLSKSSPPKHALQVFSACPVGLPELPLKYARQIREIARTSEEAGCEGMLVYTGNAQIDPWLVSQIVIEATRSLRPLVSMQPAYLHPYAAAKMVASLAYLHGRPLDLSIAAGRGNDELAALGEAEPQGGRDARLIEYATIVQRLLAGETVDFAGRCYRVHGLKLTPQLPRAMMPRVLMSAATPSARQMAIRLGAIPVELPRPPEECAPRKDAAQEQRALRLGIITRADEDAAWRAAQARFAVAARPPLAVETEPDTPRLDTPPALPAVQRPSLPIRSAYWPFPCRSARALCPYLVGSYERVADAIAHYARAGYRTLVLDGPATPDEMRHIGAALERAMRGVPA